MNDFDEDDDEDEDEEDVADGVSVLPMFSLFFSFPLRFYQLSIRNILSEFSKLYF